MTLVQLLWQYYPETASCAADIIAWKLWKIHLKHYHLLEKLQP